MTADFRELLRSFSTRLVEQERHILVSSMHLPEELKEQPAEVLMETLGGSYSLHNLDFVIDAMREVGRNDLYSELKAFKKSSGSKLPKGVRAGSPPEAGYSNFDIAEGLAVCLFDTLRDMDGSHAVSTARAEEVHCAAKEVAKNLVRLVRQANCLSRILRPPSRGSEATSPPPSTLTSSGEGSDAKEPSPPAAGFRERLAKKLTAKPKSKKEKDKDKDKDKDKSPSPKGQRKFKKSQSERIITKKQPISTTLTVPVRTEEENDSSAEDYTIPDFPDPPPCVDPLDSSRKRPGELYPELSWRQQQKSSASVVRSSPRNALTSNEPKRAPMSLHRGNLSDSGDESDPYMYDDMIIPFSLSEKSGSFTGKPESLQSEGSLREHFSRSNSHQSSTCSTPSGEALTPPATLPKPNLNLKGKAVTPSIPIHRNSVGSKSGQTVVHSGSSSRMSRNTPNQTISEIQQHILKQSVGSPRSMASSSGSSRIVSPHPVSLAKALEMDEWTGDSGCEECHPVSAAMWQRATMSRLPALTQARPNYQQDYANITIIPTSQASPPQHTDVSKLAPMYSSHSSRTPSPTVSDHTTISGMGPMYQTITVEEQALQAKHDEEEGGPDYINVKQFVEPAY